MHNRIRGTTGRPGRSELDSVTDHISDTYFVWMLVASVMDQVEVNWTMTLVTFFITCLVWMLIASVWDQVKAVSRTVTLTTILIPTFSEC